MSNMATTSTAAHAWLRSAIATALGVRVFNRVQTGMNIPDDFIVVGKIVKDQENWAGFGNNRRDEHYTITCLARVHAGPGASGKLDETLVDTLYDDAWQYVNAVAALLTPGLAVNGVPGDATLGGVVLFAELLTAEEQDPNTPEAGGLECAVQFSIACRAQVTK